MKKSTVTALAFFLVPKVYIVLILLIFLLGSFEIFLPFLELPGALMVILYPIFSIITNGISLIIQLFSISKSKKRLVLLLLTILSILFAALIGWLYLEAGAAV